uniref:Putative Cupredoxin n=1 Tax=mine drainage metagenome TaxID=410659 RepID=E6Q144_9ZZZZ
MKKGRIALLVGTCLSLALVGCAASSGGTGGTNSSAPVYIHMNGGNEFLEPTVAVSPGEPVVFVNQDTEPHTVLGYHPSTGKLNPAINGDPAGTPGAGHPVATYTVRLKKPGIYAYYCSVHAVLAKTYGTAVQPAHRPGVHGYPGAMAGEIIVTTDPTLIAQNPASSAKKVLNGYFGG